MVVLFWSGHGYPDPEDPSIAYFACHDSRLNAPASVIEMGEVGRWLERRGARNVGVASKLPGLVVTTHQVGDAIDKGETAVELVDLETFKTTQSAAPPERMILRRCGCTWGTGMLGYHVVQADETIATFGKIEREWAADHPPAISAR